jgi:hypothetical protein
MSPATLRSVDRSERRREIPSLNVSQDLDVLLPDLLDTRSVGAFSARVSKAICAVRSVVLVAITPPLRANGALGSAQSRFLNGPKVKALKIPAEPAVAVGKDASFDLTSGPITAGWTE